MGDSGIRVTTEMRRLLLAWEPRLLGVKSRHESETVANLPPTAALSTWSNFVRNAGHAPKAGSLVGMKDLISSESIRTEQAR